MFGKTEGKNFPGPSGFSFELCGGGEKNAKRGGEGNVVVKGEGVRNNQEKKKRDYIHVIMKRSI